VSWRRALLRWLQRGESDSPQVTSLAGAEERSSTPAYRLTIINCMNGRAIEVGTFKRNPHGPDWTFDMFLVQSDERISDAVVKVLAIKSLEN
jgi:hypothetical protein